MRLPFKLTGQHWAGVLTPVLFLFRSSFAFMTFIPKLWAGSIPDLFQALWQNQIYTGNTPDENWGLFSGLDVVMNQRHLPFGLSILILMLMAIMPYYMAMQARLLSIWHATATLTLRERGFDPVESLDLESRGLVATSGWISHLVRDCSGANDLLAWLNRALCLAHYGRPGDLL